MAHLLARLVKSACVLCVSRRRWKRPARTPGRTSTARQSCWPTFSTSTSSPSTACAWRATLLSWCLSTWSTETSTSSSGEQSLHFKRHVLAAKSLNPNYQPMKKEQTLTIVFFFPPFLHLLPSQGSRSRRRADGRGPDHQAGGADAVPDAAHRPADRVWHGVPGVAALCAPRPGHEVRHPSSTRRAPSNRSRVHFVDVKISHTNSGLRENDKLERGIWTTTLHVLDILLYLPKTSNVMVSPGYF